MTTAVDPAHDSGVIAAMFANREQAESARDALVADGVERTAIDIVDQTVASPAVDPDEHARSRGIWARIRDKLVPHEHAHGYAEAVERGHAMLFVRDAGERHAQIMALLEQHAPIDVMDRVQEWTDRGWSGVHRSQVAAPARVITESPATIRPPMLFQDGASTDHLRATGLINEYDPARRLGAALVNPMGIEVPGTRVTGTSRVRRYETDPDALPVDDV